jgi:hypothetical protein
MKSISTVFANALLKGGFGDGKNADAPTTLYIALSSTQPIIDAYGVISNVTEPSVSGYARVGVTNSSANWNVSNGIVTNVNSIVFPIASVTYDVQPTYVVLFTALTAGTALWCASLGQAYNIYAGSNYSFDPGTLTFTAIEGI